MIKAIVVDDEQSILEQIKKLVNSSGFIQVEKSYLNPLEALAEFETIKPEVAFLDIEMPEMDGLTLSGKLFEKNPALFVIFVTSYNQYAVQAFEMNALDYILKPINIQRFKKTTERLKNTIIGKKQLPEKALKIKCCDQLEVSIGDKNVKWERAKAEELFAFLLMHHKEEVQRDTIIDRLWPDSDPHKAAPILQTCISNIRHVFGAFTRSEVLLEFSGGRYCLTINVGDCDYFEIEKALDGFRKEDASTYSAIEKAKDLYKEGFLAQHGYYWATEKNEEIKHWLCHYLKEIAEYYSSISDNDSIIRVLEKLLILAPHEEECNNQLMQAYARAKDWSAILTHFEWLKKVLKKDYDMNPSPSTVFYYKSLTRGNIIKKH